MQYLKEEQYYTDLYDLHTIEQCLNYYQKTKDSFEEGRNSEEFKIYSKRIFDQEVRKITNLTVNVIAGERFRNKAKRIQEWVDRDRKAQEKYDNTVPPVGITCKECSASTKLIDKDLLHSYEENSQVLFMFQCTKCNKREAYYEDGTEWVYEDPKCPDCYSPLNHNYKNVDEVMTTTYACTKCSYKKEDVYDFKRSKLEREEKEAKDKKLLADYRKAFVLSTEDGEEYIDTAEAMSVANEIYKEELQEFADPVYEISKQIKKLGIVELEKLLSGVLEKGKYTNLSFDKPEMSMQVIVPFTAQDADPSRKENISTSALEKLLKDTLEGTNWRLMSDGVRNRLGFVYGKLKGYEGEEAMLELAGKKEEQKPIKIDDERRQKYRSHSVVQLAKLSAEVRAEENIRKRRLDKEPKGFAVPANETRSCQICLTHIDSANGWYDKYGFKCLDCQKAADEGILPSVVFEDDHCWDSDWGIESDFGIPKLVIKRLVKEGQLKPRIVTNSTGKEIAHVFIGTENDDLAISYKQKHKIILLCGLPGTGKTSFGEYLKDKHDYTYISVQDKEWSDKKLQSLWDETSENTTRQYNRVEKFVCYLYENYENVVLEWSFSMARMSVASLLRRQWCEVVWFSSSIPIAKKRFIQNNKNSATYFDTQIKSIEENNEKIIKDLEPKIMDVLKEDRTDKTMEGIYSEFSRITCTTSDKF